MSRFKRIALPLALCLAHVACEGSSENATKSESSNKDATVNTNDDSKSAEPPRPAVDLSSVKPEQIGKDVVGMLQGGKLDELQALFTPEVAAALPKPALAQLWPGLVGQVGDYKEVLGARVEQQDGYDVVFVTTSFESTPMDVIVVLDKERKIAGLRVAPSTAPAAFGPRPQTPKPPFPYENKEVQYKNASDQSTIAGSLTIPAGDGPHPAVLMITGSGAQDRDETLFGHKPFFVIADHLTRRGVAVLRVDDRGVGGTTGDPQSATIETHATDVEAGIAFLKSQADIDAKRIGLVGHSEGGIIAAIVAGRSNDVAFVVSLAGTGLPGHKISALQVEALLRAEGVSEEGVKALVAEQNKVTALALANAPDASIEAALKASIEATKQHIPESSAMSPEVIEAQISQGVATLKVPWVRSFFETDPAEHWKNVRCPTLVLIGSKDFQVPPKPNLEAIAAATKGNAEVKLVELDGLNHLFQKAETGMLDEYAKIEHTIDPSALDTMTQWVTSKTVPE